jgi:alkylation response protein AidB-like acyl-CoA dehydrogenase
MTRIEDDEQSVRLLGRDPPGHTAPMNDEVARHRAPDRLTLARSSPTRHAIHTIFEGTSEIQHLVIARAISGMRVE